MESSGSPLSKLNFHNACRTTAIFKKSEQVGAGTYGQVWKAQEAHNESNQAPHPTVALKRIRMEAENEGFPITAIREIKILKQLKNLPNIIDLREVVVSNEKEVEGAAVYLVFEYMDHDLSGLLEQDGFKAMMTTGQIKCYMRQLLNGLMYLHKANILHRDIKTANLLINNKGELKLADFGLARPLLNANTNPKYTNRVITLWYRPPELLLGAVQYGPAIDVWSAGCVLAELLDKRSPFQASKTEAEQIDLIWRLVGAPTPETWPDVERLPLFSTMKPKRAFPSTLKSRYGPAHGEETVSLLTSLLCLNPASRISAEESLDHDFFFSDPLPLDPADVPPYHVSSHEFTAKRRKKEGHQLQNAQQQNQVHRYNMNNNNHNNFHNNNNQMNNNNNQHHYDQQKRLDPRDMSHNNNNDNNNNNNNNNQFAHPGQIPPNRAPHNNNNYNNNNNNKNHPGYNNQPNMGIQNNNNNMHNINNNNHLLNNQQHDIRNHHNYNNNNQIHNINNNNNNNNNRPFSSPPKPKVSSSIAKINERINNNNNNRPYSPNSLQPPPPKSQSSLQNNINNNNRTFSPKGHPSIPNNIEKAMNNNAITNNTSSFHNNPHHQQQQFKPNNNNHPISVLSSLTRETPNAHPHVAPNAHSLVPAHQGLPYNAPVPQLAQQQNHNNYNNNNNNYHQNNNNNHHFNKIPVLQSQSKNSTTVRIPPRNPQQNNNNNNYQQQPTLQPQHIASLTNSLQHMHAQQQQHVSTTIKVTQTYSSALVTHAQQQTQQLAMTVEQQQQHILTLQQQNGSHPGHT
jgi:cyclin-dependent kinase 12/13